MASVFVFIAQSAYSDRKHWFRMQNMGGSGPLVSAIFKELVAELCGRAVSPRMGAGVAALATVENVEFLLKVLEALEATGILGGAASAAEHELSDWLQDYRRARSAPAPSSSAFLPRFYPTPFCSCCRTG